MNTPTEFIPAGNRKALSYGVVIQSVENAMSAKPEVITHALRVCGIAEYGAEVPVGYLNSRLKAVMENYWSDER